MRARHAALRLRARSARRSSRTTELFVRSVGETTDIVQKEMYTFADRKGRSPHAAARGHGAASCAPSSSTAWRRGRDPRASATLGPMFRYERPQAGRYRQFHQFGAERSAPRTPAADVEMIVLLLVDVLAGARGSRDVSVSAQLGRATPAAGRAYRGDAARLPRAAPRGAVRRLPGAARDATRCACSTARCRACRAIASAIPSCSSPCATRAASTSTRVRGRARGAGRRARASIRGSCAGSTTTRAPRSRCTTARCGAQSALGGGGRYDGLIEDFGGPPRPAVGFSAGMERDPPVLGERPRGRPARRSCRSLPLGDAAESRRAAASCASCAAGFARGRDRSASTGGARRSSCKPPTSSAPRFAVILGEDERARGEVMRQGLMASGEQSRMPASDDLDACVRAAARTGCRTADDDRSRRRQRRSRSSRSATGRARTRAASCARATPGATVTLMGWVHRSARPRRRAVRRPARPLRASRRSSFRPADAAAPWSRRRADVGSRVRRRGARQVVEARPGDDDEPRARRPAGSRSQAREHQAS